MTWGGFFYKWKRPRGCRGHVAEERTVVRVLGGRFAQQCPHEGKVQAGPLQQVTSKERKRHGRRNGRTGKAGGEKGMSKRGLRERLGGHDVAGGGHESDREVAQQKEQAKHEVANALSRAREDIAHLAREVQADKGGHKGSQGWVGASARQRVEQHGSTNPSNRQADGHPAACPHGATKLLQELLHVFGERRQRHHEHAGHVVLLVYLQLTIRCDQGSVNTI